MQINIIKIKFVPHKLFLQKLKNIESIVATSLCNCLKFKFWKIIKTRKLFCNYKCIHI